MACSSCGSTSACGCDKLKRICFVYTLSDPITKEIRYIGQTIQPLKKRLLDHIKEAKTNKVRNHRLNWISSLLKNNITPSIELLEDNAIWSDSEKYWISQFKTLGYRLVNGTEGGDRALGLKMSEEAKLKI